MTPTTLAETILRDVIRWTMADNVKFLAEHEVLAALTAAMDPSHDNETSAIAERAGEVAKRLRAVCTCNIDSSPCMAEDDCRDAISAADLITALLAQNTALRAEVRKSAMDAVSAGCQAQEAWEAQKAAEAERDTLRAELDKWMERCGRERAFASSHRIRAEAAEAKVEKLRGAGDGLHSIVEGIQGAMQHGTWRDEKGQRLKDTPEWVAFYNARAATTEATQ